MADNTGSNPFKPLDYDPVYVSKVWIHGIIVNQPEALVIHPTFSLDEVALVWFSKTLGNWKALFTTSLPDGLYYEVTHNGAKNETYIDIYEKVRHILADIRFDPATGRHHS